jgi:hypothetical protein
MNAGSSSIHPAPDVEDEAVQLIMQAIPANWATVSQPPKFAKISPADQARPSFPFPIGKKPCFSVHIRVTATAAA